MTIEAQLDRIIALLEAKVNPTPAAKTRKATSAPVAVAAESAPAPVASPATTGQLNTGAAQPAATVEAVATAAKEPTLDDVRAALVALQTRKGTKAPAQAILEKFSPTKVTGGLPKDKYATVIAECTAA